MCRRAWMLVFVLATFVLGAGPVCATPAYTVEEVVALEKR